ncbi:hypothetical protein GP486_006417 [Trichoglossum hirsutum]|uniref:Uncharacterized protein n=1 Tax=Trichoglossum hirsutum TaxID=265104 RepID=A0A9P8IHB2_9PEZI|nr:hypothetical protein GP486_006417 [Trichoglossum hirsutum]
MRGANIFAFAVLGTLYFFSSSPVHASPDPAAMPIAQGLTLSTLNSSALTGTGHFTTASLLNSTTPTGTVNITTTSRLNSTPLTSTSSVATTSRPSLTATSGNTTAPVVIPVPSASTSSTRQTSPASSGAGPTTSSQRSTGHPTTSTGVFVVPLATITSSIAEPSKTPTGALYYATNPANPQQTVAFGSTTLPPSERSQHLDATDAAPLALLLAGFAGVALLFGEGLLVFPLVPAGLAAVPAWLTL